MDKIRVVDTGPTHVEEILLETLKRLEKLHGSERQLIFQYLNQKMHPLIDFNMKKDGV